MKESFCPWTTIRWFYAPGEALLLKSVLESNGIPAFVNNEYLGSLLVPLTFSGMKGGIELQVPSDRVEEALDVLQGLAEEEQDSVQDDEGVPPETT